MEAPSETGSADGGRDGSELAALRAGDEAAFLALVSRHQGAMLRIAMTYVRSRAVAEEVVQEAWIGVLRGLHRFEGRSSLRCWIFSILVNCAKTRGVHEQRTVPLSALAPEGEDDAPAVAPDRFRPEGDRWAGHWADPPEPWPDERLDASERVALVREALETLPAAQRTVMSLRDLDGWETDEVCALLGISEGNQRVLLHRARTRVRSYVERRLRRGDRP